jgi:hypothetical protein
MQWQAVARRADPTAGRPLCVHAFTDTSGAGGVLHSFERLDAISKALAAHLLAAAAMGVVVLGAFLRADLAGDHAGLQQ